MKAGKYPVKHSYRLPMLISDVFSLGLAALIFSATANFLAQRADMLSRIGADNIALITAQDPSFAWKHHLAWIFPALALGVFAAYIIFCCTSHKFAKYPLSKLTAQPCRDTAATVASLCKIPLLMGIFDAMYIFHNRMNGAEESLFSIQFVLDALIIAILIRFCIHRLKTLTAQHAAPEADGAAVRVAVKATPQEKSAQQEDDK